MRSKIPAPFELSVLQHLASNQDQSVRDLYEHFAKEKGYTRGTVVKTMDRLMSKGHVSRELVNGTYRYRADRSIEELHTDQVAAFIRERLGGNIRPLAVFLAGSDKLEPEDALELQRILEKLSDV